MEKTKLNGLAVTSFVLSLMSFTFIAALIGHRALKKIQTTGQRGRGLAKAGVIIGWTTTALWVTTVVLFFAYPALLASFINGFFEGIESAR
jgi:hypothetical protein